MNEHIVRRQIDHFIGCATSAIQNRGDDPMWLEVVNEMAASLVKLSKSLSQRKNSVDYFGKKQFGVVTPSERHSVQQSINDKTNKINSVEAYIASQWMRIAAALEAERKRKPWDDKELIELCDMLASEIETFDKLIKTDSAHLEQLLQSNSLQGETIVIQQSFSHLRLQPNSIGIPSTLLLLALALRLAGMLIQSANNKK